ncbi:MAG: hypothetical protein HC876_10785, partial [Chloroflexaceae bacterium]|nr:hypothetical protein [Chloroflexaceae bacterium]
MSPSESNQQRADAALRCIAALYHERQCILRRCEHTPFHRRAPLLTRLYRLDEALAHAHEERRRACAGAPPAPTYYNPLQPVSMWEERWRRYGVTIV